MTSFTAGIPTIIHPFFGDQFFWADRVEALGVGSGVRRLTVESLTDALRAATTDLKQIEKAKAVGEKIRSVSTSTFPSTTDVVADTISRRMAWPPPSNLYTATSNTHAP